MRHDADQRSHEPTSHLEDAELLEPLERQRGECTACLVDPSRSVEDEQLDERSEWLDALEPALVERDIHRSRQKLSCRAKHCADTFTGQPSRAQGGAKLFDRPRIVELERTARHGRSR